MYIVTITNDGARTEIQNNTEKLMSGSVVQGINTIDSCTFSLLPSNVGFDKLREYKTLVKVFNTNKNRYEFQGRVLYSRPAMSESGLITKDVTCESFLGYLCDSQQEYVEERSWNAKELLEHIIDVHNSQVEEEKRFTLGTVYHALDTYTVTISRKNTFETLKEVIGKFAVGCEMRFDSNGGQLCLHFEKEFGTECETEIALSKNMKSISKESDPTAFITRLIPLGAKIGDTEERVGIEAFNGGKPYIDDEQAIELYGIHVGYLEDERYTDGGNLLAYARQWLRNNNKVQIKYSITALDLSLLDLEIEDYQVYNKYPVKNKLLGIDDTVRVIKKNINLIDETASTMEIGDNFKSLSEMQIEQSKKMEEAANKIIKIEGDYVPNKVYQEEKSQMTSLIEQTAASINLMVENGEIKGSVLITAINSESVAKISADRLDIEGKTLNIKVAATNITGKLSANQIDATNLTIENGQVTVKKDVILFKNGSNIAGLRFRTDGSGNPYFALTGIPANLETDDDIFSGYNETAFKISGAYLDFAGDSVTIRATKTTLTLGAITSLNLNAATLNLNATVVTRDGRSGWVDVGDEVYLYFQSGIITNAHRGWDSYMQSQTQWLV